MKTIIKAQRSIPNGERILIYNKDRSIHQELENEEALSTAIGDRHKCYFEVNIDDNGLMSIVREVKETW